MEIKLRIDGKEKTYTAPFVPAMVFRNYIEYQASMDFADLKADDLDKLVGLVVTAFEGQFTVEQFFNGIPSDDLMPTVEKYVLHGGKDVEVGNEQAEKK